MVESNGLNTVSPHESSNMSQHTAQNTNETCETIRNKTIIFGLNDKIGALASVLKFFESHNVNLKHIESRSSKKQANSYEFVVSVDEKTNDSVIEDLKSEALYIEVISKSVCREEKPQSQNTIIDFPRRIRDLDGFRENILHCGRELEADHPGFSDQEYRERRRYFADIAMAYNHGEPIPRVSYTAREVETWKVIFDKLVPLYEKYACKEYNHIFPLMVQNCGYRRDNIPQLEDISRFLKDSTGFSLRPVAGLLTSRDFLNGLAYRVFHSTQYIRHHANPNYTPEPDICHELLGHAPLFADPDFARFSQEIGMASLGAPDEYIEKLATCYWFTIEFGLCMQDGQMKAYGAGLLSSFGELEYSMSGKPEIRAFDPVKTGAQKYPITQYQPIYYLAESFADAQAKLHDYALSIPKPFVLRYNPYTESVDILESANQLSPVCKELKNEISLIVDSLESLRKKAKRVAIVENKAISC